MQEKPPEPDRFVALWVATFVGPAAVQIVLSMALAGFGIAGSSVGLFWLVVVAAGSCVLTSSAVLMRAHRRREPELGYIGLFFMAVSLLPLVHGLTSPGVLYGTNSATISAAQWSIPVALVLAGPLLLPPKLRRQLASRLWGRWSVGGLVALSILTTALLINTELLPVLQVGSTSAFAMGGLAFVGCATLSCRHLYLAQVANSPLPLVVSAGFGFVGGSVFVWFGAEPFSVGFWVAHVLDLTGVLAGSVGSLIVLRSTSRVKATIEPILATDPLAALELGMDPVVHRFVADLDAKDPITRDHVVRTAELAVEIGTDLGLGARELRQAGLTGLLHDVGKLDIPDAILNKPDRLDDDEYTIMKRHAAFGQTMVESSPALADIGPYIRAHHERVDGNGYPDGRAGKAIPLIARIVAVCDAFDAMANSRQYRDGMGVDRALAILREHSGSQWDASVVDAAIEVVGRRSPATDWRLDAVGRTERVTDDSTKQATVEASDDERLDQVVGCDCVPTRMLTAET